MAIMTGIVMGFLGEESSLQKIMMLVLVKTCHFFILIKSNATKPLVRRKQTQINGALFVSLLAHNEYMASDNIKFTGAIWNNKR